MRENGVKIPAPNTSGKGPIFNTKGLDTSSTQFTTAERKCRSDLHTAFGGAPGRRHGRGSRRHGRSPRSGTAGRQQPR